MDIIILKYYYNILVLITFTKTFNIVKIILTTSV